MLDLSEEPLEENVATCKRYFQRMAAIGMTLEMELGITGGEEDGVDNTGADERDLYSKPEEVAFAYEQLMEVSDRFTIAAAFGNVHGVYKPGNVKLRPPILRDSQEYIQQEFGTGPKPVDFVFHGGSGSSAAEIREAISYGIVKMNIDTDLQWAFWGGIRGYEAEFHDYLQGQIGNPNGPDEAEQEAVRPASLAAGRRGIVHQAPDAGLRGAQQHQHAGLSSARSRHSRRSRATKPVRSFGVKNVDFGGISSALAGGPLDLGDAHGADQHGRRRRAGGDRREHLVEAVLVGDSLGGRRAGQRVFQPRSVQRPHTVIAPCPRAQPLR